MVSAEIACNAKWTLFSREKNNIPLPYMHVTRTKHTIEDNWLQNEELSKAELIR